MAQSALAERYEESFAFEPAATFNDKPTARLVGEVTRQRAVAVPKLSFKLRASVIIGGALLGWAVPIALATMFVRALG